jgi:RNA-binding protein 39
LGLSGQKLLGVPVVIQPSQAEKNRVGNYSDPMVRPEKGPMKLYIGSLHFNITEDMLKGKLNTVQISYPLPSSVRLTLEAF